MKSINPKIFMFGDDMIIKEGDSFIRLKNFNITSYSLARELKDNRMSFVNMTPERIIQN